MGVKIDRGSKLEFKELYTKMQSEKDKNGKVKLEGSTYDSFSELMDGLRDSLMREIKLMVSEIAFDVDAK